MSRTNAGLTTDRDLKETPESECAHIVKNCQRMGYSWKRFSDRYKRKKTRLDKSFKNLKLKVDRNQQFNNDERVDYKLDKCLMDILRKYDENK